MHFSNENLLHGLGIDLVSLSRIRKFLNRHPAATLARLFTPDEIRQNGKKLFTLKTFARHWAAKEAFFKSCRQSWMGLEGFSKIGIQFEDGHRFSARHEQGQRGEGTVFQCGRKFLGAQAMCLKG